ncbi:SH3 domain-containing protein [Streptomyces sp. JJ36]|uniref:SH3 domain-containing protein n=1 Tax=Streptomyces sp. JJ36 TaxID=2736645 RepID=UPI001F41E8CA|nr:SH3 domain-containing protein [Streptomyces sp. JJ36]MCF6524183.1 SH3 domain-containing protein [Streptomyces sp. JJ36]
MRKVRKAALAAVAAGALALGTGASSAHSSAGTPASDAAPAGVANTQVHAWTYAKVREQPNTHSRAISHVDNGYTYAAICWTYGQKITYKGYTSSKWVLLDRTWPKPNGYVTAIALSGDSTGGVPNRC